MHPKQIDLYRIIIEVTNKKHILCRTEVSSTASRLDGVLYAAILITPVKCDTIYTEKMKMLHILKGIGPNM